MNIWRVHLKPALRDGRSYREILEFCYRNNIIGVGWSNLKTTTMDNNELKNEIEKYYPGGGKDEAFRAINTIRKMKPGDLVWTRIGGDASEYYLCQVGNILWKDREVTEEHQEHDIGNFVSAKWIYIGTEDKVPGKVINSLAISRTAQSVSRVGLISKYIWNMNTQESKDRYDDVELSKEKFWEMISSEDLESLVLLYLQSKGYYVYSTTLKRSSPKFEAIMISSDGSHKCFPQVKKEVPLLPLAYSTVLKNNKDKVYLFTTSENYGYENHPQVICLKKIELEHFINGNMHILPQTTLYWINMVKGW